MMTGNGPVLTFGVNSSASDGSPRSETLTGFTLEWNSTAIEHRFRKLFLEKSGILLGLVNPRVYIVSWVSLNNEY